jgi:NAD(P) transhydrogenase subunit beta
MKNEAFAMISYLIAAIFFILALRGLSSPTSSRLGNIFGMVGMGIAIITTLMIGTNLISLLIAVPLISGAFIGIYVAKKVEMTKMPELVALMHSFVGFSRCANRDSCSAQCFRNSFGSSKV